jgi:membrane associated rhomboid family serine protease
MGTFNSKSIFKEASKSDIIKIILVVTILFVLLQFIRITMLISSNDAKPFYEYLWNKLILPSDFNTFIRQPWTLFTYFFLDQSFMGIVGNMIWLWIFGSVIEDLKGPNRIVPIFITGGFLGAVIMLIFSAIRQTPPQLFEGASAGVMAVAFATLMFKPDYKFWMFFGLGIPIWVFVLLFIGLRLASIQVSNLPSLFILFGGLLAGITYTNILHNYYERFTNLLRRSEGVLKNQNFVLPKPSRSPKMNMEPRIDRRSSITPSKIDDILDKINEKGLHSLSKEERRILDEYSQLKKDQ